ncbi:MAG: RibD family protein, partial [Nitrospinaceae bacterium]
LDGKIATRNGESQWITSPAARARVHDLRSRVDALLVGARTVIKDDPRLTARPKNRRERYPVRVILDTRGQVPLRARVFDHAATQRVIYAVADAVPTRRAAVLAKKGVEVVRVAGKMGKPDLPGLMDLLGERGIMALMIEGGGATNALALEAGVVDKMMWFIAPLVLGGSEAPTAVGGAGAARLQDAWKVKSLTVEWIGRDLLVEGYF